jgi:heat shock protein HslJ
MNRSSITVLGPALLAVALVACSSSSGGSSSPGGPSASASLDGHTYLSTQLEGAILVPGTQVRLSFTDGNLNAHGGCNMMGGAYRIEGDRIRTTQMSMTEMACDPPRMQQDEWLGRFLSDVAFTVEGDTLTLTDGTATLTLLDEEVAIPDKPLDGTRWVLDGLVTGDAVSSVPAGVTASMRIDGSRLELQAGCNQGGGSVEIAPDTVTFGPIALTKMACEGGAMSVENAVIGVMAGTVPYTIDGDTLTLGADATRLVFRAAS